MNITTYTPEEALGMLNEVESKNAPEKLYCLGDTSLLKNVPRVSIIGSRKATPEGILRAKALAKMLVKKGFVVVSGLAEGIDTAGHTSAIDCGGRTIAVIGTPLNKSFPSSNRDLQSLIGREHLLVSQFPIGYPGGKKNFPMRNRTMALISDATVIVEGNDGSGTLHQGWEALRLGRPLFIMESTAANKNLKWPGEMISYGAEVLTRDAFDDLVDALPKGSRDELAAFSF